MISPHLHQSQSLARDSNMELLRIVAMIFVLVVHACGASFGAPAKMRIVEAPLSVIVELFTESIVIVCVNLFVLLSGGYGIKAKKNSLLKLLFQVFFFTIVGFNIYKIVITSGIQYSAHLSDLPVSALLFNILLVDFWDYWFVKSYLLLFILSPMLNAFVEHVAREQFKTLLINFFIFQTAYGWLFEGVDHIAKGYSTISFIGLYLLARYVKIYRPRIAHFNKYHDLLIYLFCTLMTTGFAVVMLKVGNKDWAQAAFYYCSPLVVIASLYLVLFFSKIKIRSRFINTIAVSAFAVYLFHCQSQLFHYYKMFISQWYNNSNIIVFLSYTILFIIAVFIASVLLDKVRIICWNALSKHIVNKVS